MKEGSKRSVTLMAASGAAIIAAERIYSYVMKDGRTTSHRK